MAKHFLLLYDLAPDYLERRGEFRREHLALAWKASADSGLVLAGALTEPVDTAVLLFVGETSEAAEAFAEADPYVKHGLVLGYRVREWSTVAGDSASNPVRDV